MTATIHTLPGRAPVPAPAAANPVLAAPPSDDIVADLLLAMDAAPWDAPRIWTVRPLHGRATVVVVVAGLRFALTPHQARAVGAARLADGGPASAGDAAALREAADEADAVAGLIQPMPGGRTGRAGLALFLLALMAALALAVQAAPY